MGTLYHTIRINVPVHEVWAVLADIEAVQHYNPGVAQARCISPARQGVGATRRCELKPKGWVEERVTAWEPERVHGMEVSASEWPIVFMKWQTELQPEGSGTLVRQRLDYQLKFGLFGKLLDRLMMRRKLEKTLNDVFASMKRFVEDRSRSNTQIAC